MTPENTCFVIKFRNIISFRILLIIIFISLFIFPVKNLFCEFLEIQDPVVSPSPFSPDDNAFNDFDTTYISYTLTAVSSTTRIQITLRDSTVYMLNLTDEGPGRYVHPWNGKNKSGEIVVDGKYNVSIKVRSQTSGQDSVSLPLVVDTKAPVARILHLPYTTISPDGDGIKDSLYIGISVDTAQAYDITTIEIRDIEDKFLGFMKYKAGGGDYREKIYGRTKKKMFWDGYYNSSPVEEGSYRFIINSIDIAMNKSEIQGLFYVDLYPPEIKILEPEPYTRFDADSIVINGNCEDKTGKVSLIQASPDNGLTWFKVFSGTTDSLEWKYTLKPLKEGLQHIRVRAYDGENHMNNENPPFPEATINLIYDTSAPVFISNKSLDPDLIYKNGDILQFESLWDDSLYDVTADFSFIDTEAGIIHGFPEGNNFYKFTHKISEKNEVQSMKGIIIPITAQDRLHAPVLNKTFKVELDNFPPEHISTKSENDRISFSNGDTVTLITNWNGDDYHLEADFSLLDENYKQGEYIENLGNGEYRINYMITLNNMLPDSKNVPIRIQATDKAGNISKPADFPVELDNFPDDILLPRDKISVVPGIFDCFKNSLHITFEITNPGSQDSLVNTSVDVYEKTGSKLIKRILSGLLKKGQYSVFWDAKDISGIYVSDGLYLIVFESRIDTLFDKVERQIRLDTIKPSIKNLQFNPSGLIITSDGDGINDSLQIYYSIRSGDDFPCYSNCLLKDMNNQILAYFKDSKGDSIFYGNSSLKFAFKGENIYKDGLYRIEISAWDEAYDLNGKRVHQALEIYDFGFDINGPIIVLDSLGSFIRFESLPMTISGTAKDFSGVKHMQFSLDEGKSWNEIETDVSDSISWSFELTDQMVKTTDDTITLIIQGEDNFGHKNGENGVISEIKLKLLYDPFPPVIKEISTPDPDKTYTNGDTITINVTTDSPDYVLSADFSRIDSEYQKGDEEITAHPGLPDYTIKYAISLINMVNNKKSVPILITVNDLFHAVVKDSSFTVDLENELPQRINIPARFDPGDKFEFNLENNASIKIEIFNLAADHIVTLYHNQYAQKITIPWDLKGEHGKGVSNGAFIIRVSIEFEDGKREEIVRAMAIFR